MPNFALAPNMLLGVTVSAPCTGGAETDSAGCPAGPCDAWRADALLMRSLGIRTCRLTAPWALIEPREGTFEPAAVERLREEILLLRGLGIIPLLTLHSFSEPAWFVEKGGWENPENARYFLKFVEHLIRRVGHLVNEYVTIHEPNVYARRLTMPGGLPTGKRSRSPAALRILSVLCSTHIRCYRLVHDLRRQLGFSDTKVGCSLMMRAVPPKGRLPRLPAGAAHRETELFESRPLCAMATGRFRSPLRNMLRARPGDYCDFLGLSYGGRISPARGRGAYRDDLGREIRPQGIAGCCRRMLAVAGKPIYITENGVCDNGDVFRARYIAEHLEALGASGLPVLRYYYHSFFDSPGRQGADPARFGLVGVDQEGRRTVKDSGTFYAELIQGGGVSAELYARYVAGREYHR